MFSEGYLKINFNSSDKYSSQYFFNISCAIWNSHLVLQFISFDVYAYLMSHNKLLT
jgi:hypothetical protein